MFCLSPPGFTSSSDLHQQLDDIQQRIAQQEELVMSQGNKLLKVCWDRALRPLYR